MIPKTGDQTIQSLNRYVWRGTFLVIFRGGAFAIARRVESHSQHPQHGGDEPSAKVEYRTGLCVTLVRSRSVDSGIRPSCQETSLQVCVS